MELDVNRIGEVIGLPPQEWEGKCHIISNLILKGQLVRGRLRYGHYRGPIASSSMFYGLPIVRHGWIELPSGEVYDPTRWVFEGVGPYIYMGPGHEYDAGGQVFKELTTAPVPKFNKDSLIWYDVPANLAAQLSIGFGLVFDEGLGYPRACLEQLFWVANLPINKLGHLAKPLYEWINSLNQRPLIPFDNWDIVVNG